ncbi:MAG: hypothetical protein OXF79_20690 [Chloroflexi bacterium]|nr:hypothetical protein [Chloroflexota bacterium]
MREIREDIAKDCLLQLLVIVEQGEPVAITRDGLAVAHLVPAHEGAGEVTPEDAETLKRQKALAENFIEWCAQQEPMSDSLQDILGRRSSDRT